MVTLVEKIRKLAANKVLALGPYYEGFDGDFRLNKYDDLLFHEQGVGYFLVKDDGRLVLVDTEEPDCLAKARAGQ